MASHPPLLLAALLLSACAYDVLGPGALADDDTEEHDAGSPDAGPEGTCTDGRQNGGESDEDCGGPCARCPEHKRCRANGDCESEQCYGGRDQEATCLGACVPFTAAQACDRASAACGVLTDASDGCGGTRTYTCPGTCAAPRTCGKLRANRCDCALEAWGTPVVLESTSIAPPAVATLVVRQGQPWIAHVTWPTLQLLTMSGGEWRTVPVSIAGLGDVSSAALALDGDVGHLLISEHQGRLVTSSSADFATWSAAAVVAPAQADTTTHPPRLAIDPDGTAWAALLRDLPGESAQDLRLFRRAAGGAFALHSQATPVISAMELVSNPGRFPSLAVHTKANALQIGQSTQGRIEFSSVSPGYALSLAAAPDGTSVIGYFKDVGVPAARLRTPAGDVSPEFRTPGGGHFQSLALDASRTLHAVTANETAAAYMQRYEDGVTASTVLPSAFAGNVPRVALGADGAVHLVVFRSATRSSTGKLIHGVWCR